jgi:hypothetical protein
LVDSGTLVTVSVSPASHPASSGSEPCLFCDVWAFTLVVGVRAAPIIGAACGVTAGARGVIGFAGGTGGAPRGVVVGFGLVTLPDPPPRDSLTAPASLILRFSATE